MTSLENKKLKVIKTKVQQFILGRNTESTQGTLTRYTHKIFITRKANTVAGARKQRKTLGTSRHSFRSSLNQAQSPSSECKPLKCV